jgi:chemotaxis signal transduction protein
MTDSGSHLATRAAELRLAFDRVFAEPGRRDATAMENLLTFGVGSEPYALRLSDIAGLFADRKISRLPSGLAALLGFAGFRGAIVPVYDLHVLLGRPKTEAPRWLVVAAAAPVALAFETFEGHLRLSHEAIVSRAADDQSPRAVRDVASWERVVRPIVHMPSVLAAIGAPQASANMQRGAE